MQLNNDTKAENKKSQNNSDINFYKYLDTLVRNWKLIVYINAAAFTLALLVCLFYPKMYVATTQIMPPKDNSNSLSSMLSTADDPLARLTSGLIGNQTPASIYVGIMKSRGVADALNQKFKLRQYYGMKYIEDVYSKLESRSKIEISKKDQLITVEVRDRAPERAAEMANMYVEMLEKINRRLGSAQGKSKRVFLESRLKEVNGNLEKAEVALRAFQERHHLVSIEEQSRVAIEGAADIQGQIMAAQTELEVFKQFGTERQTEAVVLKTKIDELQKQLESIEDGQNLRPNDSIKPIDNMKFALPTQALEGKNPNFYVPLGKLPELGMQLIRLTREAKIQEKLFELLTAQYEMAQIEEARDINTIQVIDRAVAPEKWSTPQRGLIIKMFVSSSLMISIIVVFGYEYLRRN